MDTLLILLPDMKELLQQSCNSNLPSGADLIRSARASFLVVGFVLVCMVGISQIEMACTVFHANISEYIPDQSSRGVHYISG